MIPPAQFILLFCHYNLEPGDQFNPKAISAREPVIFKAVICRAREGVQGDIHHYRTSTGDHLFHGFACPMCKRIFIVSDTEQLRHPECPITLLPEDRQQPIYAPTSPLVLEKP